VVVHFRGRVKDSAEIVDMIEVWVLGWRRDRIAAIREYKNKEEALTASEPAA
jgi:hypothetical protein